MGHATLLYDEDCGFCRWSADKIRRVDRRGRLSFASIQSPTGDASLAGMPIDRRLASWHLVGTTGRIWSGGEAVTELLRLFPLGRPLAGLTGTFPGPTDRAYRLVARHRGRLGRLLGQQACSVDPARTQPE